MIQVEQTSLSSEVAADEFNSHCHSETEAPGGAHPFRWRVVLSAGVHHRLVLGWLLAADAAVSPVSVPMEPEPHDDHRGVRRVRARGAGGIAVRRTPVGSPRAAAAASWIAARLLQGLITGAALAAVGAAMIDLNKARGTTANAVAPPFGSALGGIIGGFFVQFLPAPTELVYAAFAAIFAAQSVGLALMKEPIS